MNFEPMVIGIYCGENKPVTAEEYLNPFVKELLQILETGVDINEHKIHVYVRCFICDTPARSFVKGTVNFNGYNSCLKCTTTGEFYSREHRISFPRIDMPLRTDASFRNKTDSDHHKTSTPLEKLPIDMVNSFPIGDSLHLIDLGIMKRLLTGWTYGTFNFQTKWPTSTINSVSDFLLQCRMPSEIHRAVRSLDCLKFWKGTEYRNFLLYLGPVILKNHLNEDVYQHFLLFFCAIVICSSDVYTSSLYVAEELISVFVEKYIKIYGISSITSNVHNLCHLVDEVKNFGILSSFISYPFENTLYKIKTLLRTGNRPLSQVARRLEEANTLNQKQSQRKKSYPVLKNENLGQNCDIDISTKFFYKVELYDTMKLTNRNNDKWFLTRTNEIVGMKNATIIDDNVYLYGSSLRDKHNFFETPIVSSHLNIYSSKCEEKVPKLYTVNDVKCKLVAVQHHDQTIFFPLIHTLDLCKEQN